MHYPEQQISNLGIADAPCQPLVSRFLVADCGDFTQRTSNLGLLMSFAELIHSSQLIMYSMVLQVQV